jgi:hypothetical protein
VEYGVQQAVLVLAAIAVPIIGMVFSLLAARHKSKDGSGLDLNRQLMSRISSGFRKSIGYSLALAAVATWLVGMSCPGRGEMHVLSGSTSTHVEIGVTGEIERMNMFTVSSCSAGDEGRPPSWVIVKSTDVDPAPNRFTVGMVPAGWNVRKDVDRLAPGCYAADGGTLFIGHVRFEVDSAGGVHELPTDS